MPNNQTEEKINNENINTEAVVITSEDKNNIFDFFEFIETSTDANAIKLRKLMQYGITEEMMLATYKDISGNIETEEYVISSLETIFSRLATYISLQPNGIIIDMETGEIDAEASFAQAVRVGIYSSDSIIEPTEDFIIDAITNIVQKSAEFNEVKAEEYIYLLNNFDSGYVSKEETRNDINNFLNTNVEDLSLSEKLKALAQKQKDIIAESKYEQQTYLYEISDIEIELERSAGTPAHMVYLAKREKFYKEHPEYLGNVPVRNPDGSINSDEVNRMNEYKEAYKIQFILSQIEEFKHIEPEKFKEQLDYVKHNIIIGIMSGLKYDESNELEFKEIFEECKKIFETICPGIDLNAKDAPETQEKLAEFAKEQMDIGGSIEKLSFENMVQLADNQMENCIEEFIISDLEAFKGEKDISKLNINKDYAYYESTLENYFSNSNIKFLEIDDEDFNKLYKMVNVNSWIQNKESALRLRYTALVTMKNEYDKYPESDYLNMKKAGVEQQIKDFEEKYGKIGMDGDELSSESNYEFEIYREYMTHTGLIKFYTRDAIAMQNGKTYESLDDEHKKAYIRNTLANFKYVDLDQEFCLSKIALRRLELMNTDDKKFVTFDENGEAIIDKELILQEYQSMSKYEYQDFDELVQSLTLRKDEYILNKLEEYTQLREEDFLKLDNPADLDKSIAQIEDIREKSNTKRIQKNADKLEKEADSKENEIVSDSDRMQMPISGKELSEAVKSGIIEVETIDDSAIRSPNVERENKAEDQIESENGANIESIGENVAELKLESIDDSATIEEASKDEQKNGGNLINTIKNAFNAVKQFINKHIKKDKKIESLGPGIITDSGVTPLNAESENKETSTLSQAELFNKRLSAEVSSLSQEQTSYQTQQATKQAYEPEDRITDDGSRD